MGAPSDRGARDRRVAAGSSMHRTSVGETSQPRSGAYDSLRDHYWAKCPCLESLVWTAWGSRVPPAVLALHWGLLSRFDVAASLYTLYAEVSRQRRTGRTLSPEQLADAAGAAR